MVASFQQHSRGRKLEAFMKISELLECNVQSLIQQMCWVVHELVSYGMKVGWQSGNF
jgi:hypothetical protein